MQRSSSSIAFTDYLLIIALGAGMAGSKTRIRNCIYEY